MEQKTVVFISLQKEFAVPLPAIAHSSTAGGKIVSSYMTPGHIKFANWIYRTNKMSEIALLRGILRTYASNGATSPFSEVLENGAGVKTPLKAPLQKSQNLSAKTKNDVIAHLVLSFGVPPKDLAGKEIEELLLFSQASYNCIFPNVKVKKDKAIKSQDVPVEKEKTGDTAAPNVTARTNEEYLQDPLAVKVTGITAKNDALAYLKNEKKVPGTVLKSLKIPAQVKEFAFNQHKIVFVDWV